MIIEQLQELFPELTRASLQNTGAQITPPVTIKGMRHTWASHAVMNGVPLMVVSKNMGHVDTTMVVRV